MIDSLAFYVVSAVFKLYNGGSASYAQCMLYVLYIWCSEIQSLKCSL